MRRAAGWVLGVVAAGGVAAAAPALTVRGDAQAWREVAEALGRLASLRSYRVQARSAEGDAVLIEFVNPDRMRMVAQGGQVEVIRVGPEQRFRVAGGPWQCWAPGPAGQVPSGGPPEGETVVTVERAPDALVDGEPTRTYRYWFGSRPEARLQLYVSARSGLPRRLEILDPEGKVRTTLDYGDFDAPIGIDLPACQR